MSVDRIAPACSNLGVSAFVLLILSPLLTRSELIDYKFGLVILIGAAGFGLLAVGCSLWAVLRGARVGQVIMPFILGAAPVVFIVVAVVGAHGLPLIHDISTDTADPPRFVAAQTLRAEAENTLDINPADAAFQTRAYPDIQPLRTPLAPAAAFERALATARQLGWEVHAQDGQGGRIEAVDTTPIFGFHDDVAIRIRPAGDGSVIDLRSVSRVGRGDLGANAKRIRRFMATFAPAR
jgi:uncharacterized protein (DUF1499 family)